MNPKLTKLWLLPLWFSLLVNFGKCASAKKQVPCYFIFGDSFSDSGNNNDLRTLAKVNYRPYGIDFRKGPTGRFSNNRTMDDVIVEFLGFKNYIVPFAKARGSISIFEGVNYASGGAGILDQTGKNLGNIIPLNQQLRNHQKIISEIKKRKPNSSELLISKCIYSLQIGSNDYLNNYFQPQSSTSSQFTPEQFAELLVQQFSKQIKFLHGSGARKFALYAIGQLGCAPFVISQANSSGCVQEINNAAMLFNNKLRLLVEELSRNITNAWFTYLSPSANPTDLLNFVTNQSCCRIGGGTGELCLRGTVPCKNRSRYVFWDGVHTTDAFNFLLAKSAFETTVDAHPFNIRQLVANEYDRTNP